MPFNYNPSQFRNRFTFSALIFEKATILAYPQATIPKVRKGIFLNVKFRDGSDAWDGRSTAQSQSRLELRLSL